MARQMTIEFTCVPRCHKSIFVLHKTRRTQEETESSMVRIPKRTKVITNTQTLIIVLIILGGNNMLVLTCQRFLLTNDLATQCIEKNPVGLWGF